MNRRGSRRLWMACGVAAVASVWRVAAGDAWHVGALQMPHVDAHRLISLAVLLLLVSIAAAPRMRGAFHSRDVAVFYGVAILVLFLLAIGPEPAWHGVRVLTYGPYRLFVDTPLGRSVRVPARLWLPAAICFAAAASLGAAGLLRRYASHRPIVATLIAVAVVAEGWFAAPVVAVPLEVTGLVPAGALVLDVPLGNVVDDVRAEYRAVLGSYRVINGYSGYSPPGYDVLTREVAARSTGTLDRYRRVDDLYVVLSENRGPEDTAWIAAQPGAERLVYSSIDASTIVAYRLPRHP